MSRNVSFTRRLLAKMYFPKKSDENAVRSLRRWIRNCKELDRALNRGCGAFNGRKELTVREVKLIFDYLGEPGE